jgi:hypothetical protein
MRKKLCLPDQMMPASQAKNVLKRLAVYYQELSRTWGIDSMRSCSNVKRATEMIKFYGTPSKEETDKLLDKGIDLFHVPKIKDN